MPMHSDRRRRGRSYGRHSELDWFAEDPWAEPDFAALDSGRDDEWYPGLWEPTDDDELWLDGETDATGEDPYDGWGPVRPRKRASHRR